MSSSSPLTGSSPVLRSRGLTPMTRLHTIHLWQPTSLQTTTSIPLLHPSPDAPQYLPLLIHSHLTNRCCSLHTDGNDCNSPAFRLKTNVDSYCKSGPNGGKQEWRCMGISVVDAVQAADLINVLFVIFFFDEQHSSRWPAHLQACKCLCPSRHTSHACAAHLVVTNQACPHIWLAVLVGATWPCAWLLLCVGSVSWFHPFQQQWRAGAIKHGRADCLLTVPHYPLSVPKYFANVITHHQHSSIFYMCCICHPLCLVHVFLLLYTVSSWHIWCISTSLSHQNHWMEHPLVTWPNTCMPCVI